MALDVVEREDSRRPLDGSDAQPRRRYGSAVGVEIEDVVEVVVALVETGVEVDEDVDERGMTLVLKLEMAMVFELKGRLELDGSMLVVLLGVIVVLLLVLVEEGDIGLLELEIVLPGILDEDREEVPPPDAAVVVLVRG
jgi:hypothetical protein